MTDYLSLAEIRRRLGLDPHDAYWLIQQRDLYRRSTHAPLMLTTHAGERPFTMEQAMAWACRELGRR